MDLVDTSLIGFHSWMVWMLFYLVQVLSWDASCGVQILHRKKLWVLSTLLSISHCGWGGVDGKIVSHPLLPSSVCFFPSFNV